MHHLNVYTVQYEGAPSSADKKQHPKPIHDLQLPTADPSEHVASKMLKDILENVKQI